jgi:hypothetical protein
MAGFNGEANKAQHSGSASDGEVGKRQADLQSAKPRGGAPGGGLKVNHESYTIDFLSIRFKRILGYINVIY